MCEHSDNLKCGPFQICLSNRTAQDNWTLTTPNVAYYWVLVTELTYEVRCSFHKLNKCDFFVIHGTNPRSANTASKMCLLESTEEIICMFLLALLCVDWQIFCLSYSVMFACQNRKHHIFLVLSTKWAQQKQVGLMGMHCSRKSLSSLTKPLHNTFLSRHMKNSL